MENKVETFLKELRVAVGEQPKDKLRMWILSQLDNIEKKELGVEIDLNLEQMSFSEAAQNLLEGKKVRRSTWGDEDYVVMDKVQGCFVNYFDEDASSDADFTMGFLGFDDFIAVDWELVG